MDIGYKTTGELIDALITTSLRCWFAQEDIMNPNLDEHQRLQAAIRAQEQNAKRTELIQEINKRIGEKTTNDTKTYHTYLEKKKI